MLRFVAVVAFIWLLSSISLHIVFTAPRSTNHNSNNDHVQQRAHLGQEITVSASALEPTPTKRQSDPPLATGHEAISDPLKRNVELAVQQPFHAAHRQKGLNAAVHPRPPRTLTPTEPSADDLRVFDDPVVRKILSYYAVTFPNSTEAQALHALRRSKRERLVKWEEQKRKQAERRYTESEEEEEEEEEEEGDDDVLSEEAASRSCPEFGDDRKQNSSSSSSSSSRGGDSMNHSSTNRVAFLFLVRGPIATEPIWRAFFGVPQEQRHGCPAPKIRDPRASVHVHSSPFFEYPEASIFARHTLTNRTFVTWGSFAVVDAMVLLLRAALGDSQNKHFAFFSEKCVPLHSLPCTHAFFESAGGRSFVDSWETDERRSLYNFTFDRHRIRRNRNRLDQNRLNFNRLAGFSDASKRDEDDDDGGGFDDDDDGGGGGGSGGGGRESEKRPAWPPSTVDYAAHWRKGHMWVVLNRRDAALVSHPLVVGEWVAAHVLGNGTVTNKVRKGVLQRFQDLKFYDWFDSSVYLDGVGRDLQAGLGGPEGKATTGELADSPAAPFDHWLHRPIADEHYVHTVLAAHGREWNSTGGRGFDRTDGEGGCQQQQQQQHGGGVNCDHSSNSNSSSSSSRLRLHGAHPYMLHFIQMKGWHAAEWRGNQIASHQGSRNLRMLRGMCEFENGRMPWRKGIGELGPPYPDEVKEEKGKRRKKKVTFASSDRGWAAHGHEYGSSCRAQQTEHGRGGKTKHLCHLFLRKIGGEGAMEKYLHQSPHFRGHLQQGE